MTQGEQNFGVVQWGADEDEQLAAPGDKSRLLEHCVGGRVVVVLGDDGDFKLIRFGEHEFRISSENIVPARNVKYTKGEIFLYNQKETKVVDVIWHYGRGEPFYILTIDGKKSSRRYFNEDLD